MTLEPQPSAPSCCIVVPIYRWPPTAVEERALSTISHLGNYPVRAITRSNLEQCIATRFPVESFPDAFFSSRASYSKLLLSADFYHRFKAWEWILIFQLDAIVAAGNLAPWLDQPIDYVGAPWLKEITRPELGFSRVGNGGLSLRRTCSFIRVLESASRPSFLACLRAPDMPGLAITRRVPKALRTWRSARTGARSYAGSYTLNEDRFWSDRAGLFDPQFRVASIDVGLRFAFESAPSLALEMTGGALPLGAHAWELFDREFWLDRVPALREGSS